jgi:Spy/CpxP family protein refolding chaperone
MKRQVSAAAFVLILALGTLAQAQASLQGDPQARMRIRENISNLYLLRLTRALDLSEEQAAKVYPLLTRVEKEKAGIQRRMGQDLRGLRAELAGSEPGEQKVLELVIRIREARSAIRQKDDEVEGVLDGILTPIQKARYLIFTVDFLRSIGENLGRARGLNGPIKRTP